LAKNVEYPVIFPSNREIALRDRFDQGRVRHHAVWLSGALWRLADFARHWSPGLRSGQGTLPATVTQAIQPAIDQLAATLPNGYRIATGGSVEESGKGQASVLAVVPLMLLLMVTILMFQLQSFQRVVLVLSVAPLGVIGVVAALLVAQAPLGFVAVLGVLALVGMIARNSVILIDQIEHERAAGKHPWDAVVTAAIHRTRPILLTASAATLGMIPIAPSVFWGPMAFAIIGGLAVATVLTLIFLPALYVAWFRIKEPAPPELHQVRLQRAVG
jgi:multidrug efflux pump subunit AcrB